jgi:3-deoxy-D-manno-octulosonic-acid transferase
MIYFYRIIYFVFSNILIYLRFLLPFKLKKWIELRQYKLKIESNFFNCIWFHAASGEIEYCKAVIRALKKTDPAIKVVVSYSSPSAERLFKNIAEHVDLFFPVPWDKPDDMAYVFSILKPKFLIFSRTDFWPEMIATARKNQVKLGVISFTANPNANYLQRLVLSKLLFSFDFISAVDEGTISILKNRLNIKYLSSDGDTRFDQVFFRLSQESKIQVFSEKPQIVFGSTWPEDEKVIFEILPELINKFKIIFSPHEVSEKNISRLEEKLKEKDLKFLRLSQISGFNDNFNSSPLSFSFSTDVLLVDRIGYLADFYRYSTLAFVGGSFKSRVHSVMEPLCCGNHVLVGPKIANSPEALRYLNQFVHVASDEISLLQKITALEKSQDKNLILNEMTKNKNASQKVVDLLFHAGL